MQSNNIAFKLDVGESFLIIFRFYGFRVSYKNRIRVFSHVNWHALTKMFSFSFSEATEFCFPCCLSILYLFRPASTFRKKKRLHNEFDDSNEFMKNTLFLIFLLVFLISSLVRGIKNNLMFS